MSSTGAYACLTAELVRMRGLAAVLLIGTMPAASALNPGVALGIDLGTSGVRVNIVEKKSNGGVDERRRLDGVVVHQRPARHLAGSRVHEQAAAGGAGHRDTLDL